MRNVSVNALNAHIARKLFICRYFTTCHLLSENTSAVERLEWDHRFSCTSQPERGE